MFNVFIVVQGTDSQLPQPAGPQPGMAQPPLAFSALGEDDVSDPELAGESPADDEPVLLEPLDDDDGFLPPSRKSVTYQPPPLRMKPVRDMSLTRGPLWQEGHSVGCGSDSFCMTSWTSPQALHSNS